MNSAIGHQIHNRMDIQFQPRGGKAKPYQIDQFLDMVEEFGLQIEK